MRDAAADVGRADDELDAEVERNLRFNFVALLTHGLLGQTGFRLVQAPTFLPHFVSLLAENSTAVGILRAVQSLGMFVSPVFSAGLVEQRDRVKSMALVFGGAMRLQILFLALIALLAPAERALGLVWLAVGLLGLALGMQGVVFQFIISKAIPVGRRGRLVGLRNAAAGVTTVMVALGGGLFIEWYGFPGGYGYTFLAGFVLTTLGLIAFATVREPRSRELRDPTPVLELPRRIPVLLRNEPDFRGFLVARLLAMAGRGVLPLYVVYFDHTFGVTGAALGVMTTLFVLTQSGGALAWGFLGDQAGFKTVFIGSLAIWIAGTLLMLVMPVPEIAYVVYTLVGAGMGGLMLASQNMVFEFGSEAERPMRIATSNSLSEFVGMIGYLVAGISADVLSFEVAFVIAILLQLLSILSMTRVTEPRHLEADILRFPDP